VADALLGPMLPQFEAAGVLLLAALIAVLAVVGGKD
jgi:NADH:ubiquinone oxidoreductase subunit 6 (subunit J)